MSHNNRSDIDPRPVLRRGERVRIRPAAKILATLDARGELDGLPFMPEMIRYCGQTARVFRSAHKTCDTIEQSGGRRMHDAVHLNDLRCDGSAHGDCQARCLMFWKEAWLERVDEDATDDTASVEEEAAAVDDEGAAELARELAANARSPAGAGDDATDRYFCQATELLRATRPLAWWNPLQYYRDWRSGNAAPSQIAHVLFSAFLRRVMAVGVGYRLVRRFHDWYQAHTTGEAWPYGRGTLPLGTSTPTGHLDLKPGETVRIRSHREILDTMTPTNRNRGLFFDVEMVPYCGGTFTVERRVERIINEKNGQMMHFKNPCIMLGGVVCQSRYSNRRLLCPRAIPSYWREIWLERVDPP